MALPRCFKICSLKVYICAYGLAKPQQEQIPVSLPVKGSNMYNLYIHVYTPTFENATSHPTVTLANHITGFRVTIFISRVTVRGILLSSVYVHSPKHEADIIYIYMYRKVPSEYPYSCNRHPPLKFGPSACTMQGHYHSPLPCIYLPPPFILVLRKGGAL